MLIFSNIHSVNNTFIEIEPSWKRELETEFEKPYFKRLWVFINKAYQTKSVFPVPKNMFTAFDLCSFDKVRVIILGQDPYHRQGQANGLAFGVDNHFVLPPSLKNIFKEIQNDLETTPFGNGDLSRWATQGVFLLNAILTVEEGIPGSHKKQGWEELTDKIIKTLSEKKEHLVFILWGNYARQKGRYIDRNKHLVLESAHPSPFSVHSGFFGSRPFSKTNAYLKKWGLDEIDWR